ncbi:hypothetical protein KQI63_14895 [bacterium]|nr:hypothetical protein [bacterium]
MKKLWLCQCILLLLLMPASSTFARWDGSTGTLFTMTRLPSPRAQALGKLSVSLADDPLLMATHPAQLGFVSTAGVSYSHSQPYGIKWGGQIRPTESYFAWLPLESRTFGKIAFGAAYNWTDFGENTITDETGAYLGTSHDYEELASVSLAGLWDKRTSFGAAFGYRANHLTGRGAGQEKKEIVGDAVTVTLSALHRIPYRVGFVHGNIHLGATAINLNEPKIIYDDPHNGDQMPLLLRAGPGIVMRVDELNLEVGLYSELQTVYEASERSGYKYGTEVTLHDFLTVRFGRFVENIDPNLYSYDQLDQQTWGGGIRLPLEWIAPDFPLAIQFDVIEGEQDWYGDFGASYLEPYTLYAVSVRLR